MYFRAQKKSSQDVSLSDYIETGTDGAALSLMEVVAEEEDLFESVCARQRSEQVRCAVAEHLKGREKQVILLRYGLNGNPPLRQREVAKLLGISRSYVSRIETKALGKLQKVLSDNES
ncbi:MAG: sigma-70 family RNA polymerase sigma factor [Ruminococcaceae bacterium]|nr:sigma-70 family RNA polymerase sigma factor [Oscillospiraceae bacterium]